MTFIRRCYRKEMREASLFVCIIFEKRGILFVSVHEFAENDGGHSADRGGDDCRPDNGSWMNAAVLLAISDDINRNQL